MTLTQTEATALKLITEKKLPFKPADSVKISQSITEHGSFSLGAGFTVGVAVNRMPEDGQTGYFPSGKPVQQELPGDTLFVSAGIASADTYAPVYKDTPTMRAIPVTPEGVAIRRQLSGVQQQIDSLIDTAVADAARERNITTDRFLSDQNWRTDLLGIMDGVRNANAGMYTDAVRLESSLFAECQKASIALGEKMGLFDPEGKQTGIKSNTVASLAITVPLDKPAIIGANEGIKIPVKSTALTVRGPQSIQ